MAKFLTSVQEIAKYVNIKRYPTFVFDVSKPYKDYKGLYKTDACMNIVTDGRKYTFHTPCDLYIEIPREREDKQVTLDDIVNNVEIGLAHTVCIKSSYGVSDILDMANKRALQDVMPGQEIVVVFNGVLDGCIVEIMRVPEKVDIFCTTVASLMPID